MQMPRNVTIASEEAYTDWSRDLDALLAARGLDIAEAHDSYLFRTAWEEGDSTRQAVDDYARLKCVDNS